MNSRHPDPRRVLGRCRAAVRGQDPEVPLDPGIGSFLRLLSMKNNENKNPISETSKINQFLDVFVIDLSFLLCFTL